MQQSCKDFRPSRPKTGNPDARARKTGQEQRVLMGTAAFAVVVS